MASLELGELPGTPRLCQEPVFQTCGKESPYLQVIRNPPDLILDRHVAMLLQLAAERVFLKRNTEFSLLDGNISNHILVGKVAVHAQESVQGLEEQDVIARKSIILDELAINHFSNTPTLEALDVAQPHRVRHTRLGEVFVKNPEEMAKSKSDVLEVVQARYLVVLLEADEGTNHFIVNRESLTKLLEAGSDFKGVIHTKISKL